MLLQHLKSARSAKSLASDQKVIGTFAMYYCTPKRPTKLDSQIVITVTRKAVIAIERARRIQRLQESEERFRALNECSPVGVFLTDVKGDCTYSNALCSEICGFSTEEALWGGWTRFLHPDDGERVVRELSRALRAGEGYEGDTAGSIATERSAGL